MPQYKARRKDCKYYVEQGLRSIGYKVNSTYQESLGNKECYVVYTGFGNELVTQQSYWNEAFIKIVLNIDDNNDTPTVIREILQVVTKYVEDSKAPECTSFKFLPNIDVNPYGTTSNVEIPASFRMESDWIDNGEF